MKNDSTKVPQFYNPSTNKFEYVEGSNGAIKVIVEGGDTGGGGETTIQALQTYNPTTQKYDYLQSTSGALKVTGNVTSTISGTVPVSGNVGITGTVNTNSTIVGTVPVSGNVGITGTVTTAGTSTVTGNVAHDGVATGNPVRIAGRAVTATYNPVATGDVADFITTTVGVQIVKPYSIPELDWSYTGEAIVDDADVVVKTAVSGTVKNYITSFQYQNTSEVATELVIKNGATVIWRGYAPASMTVPANVTFNTPIKGSANTALNVACVTTGANVYVNVQGYQAP